MTTAEVKKENFVKGTNFLEVISKIEYILITLTDIRKIEKINEYLVYELKTSKNII